jgi:hypothetical protein
MKLWIVLISLLTMASTWWWMSRNRQGTRVPLLQQLQTVIKSVIAGICVYFVLVLIAAIYLTISTY